MACEFLEYRSGDEEHSFETERAYCTVVDEFVLPMRADLCNERFGLDPATECEYYIDAVADGDR